MKIQNLIAVVCLCKCAAIACFGETFYLKSNQTGQEVGPFEFKEEAQLKLGEQVFTIVKIQNKGAELEKALKSIIIIGMKVDDARVRDAVNAFIEKGRKLDPEHRQIPVRFDLPGEEDNTEEDAPPKWMVTGVVDVDKLSLYDAIKAVCDRAGVEFRVEDTGVLIRASPKSKPH